VSGFIERLRRAFAKGFERMNLRPCSLGCSRVTQATKKFTVARRNTEPQE
jgi:hypothetical protein